MKEAQTRQHIINLCKECKLDMRIAKDPQLLQDEIEKDERNGNMARANKLKAIRDAVYATDGHGHYFNIREAGMTGYHS